ncbi:MAG: hypothetical protein H5U40_02565, partial [Polyangiaceae bacterium]|nr:hypothetical protein [Polyangiaceae bacterium]
LLNVLRRASLFAEGQVIGDELVRRMIAASVFGHVGIARVERGASPAADAVPSTRPTSGASLAEVERAHIEKVLAAMDGNVTRAAVALGIDRRTLQRKLKTYGMSGEG